MYIILYKYILYINICILYIHKYINIINKTLNTCWTYKTLLLIGSLTMVHWCLVAVRRQRVKHHIQRETVRA
jgi:hypothetical protein